MDPFINHHLLSMLGAPDFVGDINELLGVIGDAIDEIVGPALNPLRLAGAEIKEAAEDLVKDLIEEAYGIDVDQLSDFLMHPTHWLNVTDVTPRNSPQQPFAGAPWAVFAAASRRDCA